MNRPATPRPSNYLNQILSIPPPDNVAFHFGYGFGEDFEADYEYLEDLCSYKSKEHPQLHATDTTTPLLPLLPPPNSPTATLAVTDAAALPCGPLPRLSPTDSAATPFTTTNTVPFTDGPLTPDTPLAVINPTPFPTNPLPPLPRVSALTTPTTAVTSPFKPEGYETPPPSPDTQPTRRPKAKFSSRELEELARVVVDVNPYGAKHGNKTTAWADVAKQLKGGGYFMHSSVDVIKNKMTALIAYQKVSSTTIYSLLSINMLY